MATACKACQFARFPRDGLSLEYTKCAAPQNSRSEEFVVTGEQRQVPIWIYCTEARKVADACGPKAAWFKAE